MAKPDSVKRFDAFVVDKDMAARMRLKTATISVPLFGSVKLMNTLEEALGALQNPKHIDVVFISNRFDQESIISFVRNAKERPGGQDSAYVLVLKTEDQESDTIAKNVLGGADGFLLEPYSVDQLVEITHLAARVKKERSQQREAAALRFLVQDVMRQLDRVWYLKSCGFEIGPNLKKLKEMCAVFQALDAESREVYNEIIIDAFEKAPIPKANVKQYKGVSDRVRKRMEKKVMEQMDAEDETSKEGTPS